MKNFNKNKPSSDTLNDGSSVNLSLVEDKRFGNKSGVKRDNKAHKKPQSGTYDARKDDKNSQKTNKNAAKRDKQNKQNANSVDNRTKTARDPVADRAVNDKKKVDGNTPFGKKNGNKKGKKGGNESMVTSTSPVSENQAQRNPLRYEQPRGKLKIMFLGGVGEIGKNMTVFEYGNSIVILDAGMSFPGSDMPGVDVVIPDITYLVEHRDKIKGILLTHGHEDHIGAIPFVVKKLGGKVDVYGTKLTLGLVENKLLEHSAQDNVNFVPVSDKSIVSLGDFTAEFIHVSHSVAGSCAICLRTPVGTVFHTGDFKVDYTPLGNEIMNLNRIAEIGKQGVLLLMSESTNVEKPGYTMSESVVRDTMNKVFQDAKGRRIIVATFASNVDRLGMIIELAKLYKRKIAISGRSMVKYIDTACRVGQMSVDNDMIVDIDKIGGIEDGKLVILSTGSQGEPMSALTRMADGEFNKVNIGSNDTIVISANPIPGNERDVYTVINKLYRLGAVVVYSALSAVHVSGHACQEELKLLYTLIKPKYFIPVHGEYRHLKQHAMLVEKLGQKRSNITIPEIGDVVEVDKNTFKVVGQIASGNIMVDGLGVGDVGNIVLKDRLSLAEDGILVCVVGVDKKTYNIVSGPEVVSRGCFFQADGDSVTPTDEIKSLVREELANDNNRQSMSAVKTAVQRVVRKYFRNKFKRNPVVLPVVLEV